MFTQQIKIRQTMKKISDLPTLNFFGMLAETQVFFRPYRYTTYYLIFYYWFSYLQDTLQDTNDLILTFNCKFCFRCYFVTPTPYEK